MHFALLLKHILKGSKITQQWTDTPRQWWPRFASFYKDEISAEPCIWPFAMDAVTCIQNCDLLSGGQESSRAFSAIRELPGQDSLWCPPWACYRCQQMLWYCKSRRKKRSHSQPHDRGKRTEGAEEGFPKGSRRKEKRGGKQKAASWALKRWQAGRSLH